MRNSTNTITLAIATWLRFTPDQPTLITGPSGSGKDWLARKLQPNKLVGSLDHIGYWEGRKWRIDPDMVKRVVQSRKFSILTGISDDQSVWMHYFPRVIVPWIDLATAQATCRHKEAQRRSDRIKDGLPPEEGKMWKEPHSLEDYYRELYKLQPFGYKGDLVRVDNSRSKNEGYAWSEWNQNKEEQRRMKDLIRQVAGYTAEHKAKRDAGPSGTDTTPLGHERSKVDMQNDA